MKVAIGKVIGGKIVLDGETLHEGAVVTVVVHDDAEAFDTTPEEDHALLEAIAQADWWRRSKSRPVRRSESRPLEGGSFYGLLI
jgi:hypothetical protein